jgi:hypothetical protein
MNPEFGKKPKHEFFTIRKDNIIRNIWNKQVIIQITYKDFMQLAKRVQRRHKQFSKNKKGYTHFTHMSPDVSFLMVKK